MVEKQHSVDVKQRRHTQSHGRDNCVGLLHVYLTPVTKLTRKGGRPLPQRFTHWFWLCLVILSPAISLLGPACDSQSNCRAAEVNAPNVQRAIDRGVAYLRKSQNDRGGWEEYGGQSCGASALCTLALLNAGASRDDPAIVKAMRYLRASETKEIYSVSLQTLVFCQLGAAGDLPRIRRNVSLLTKEQQIAGMFDRAGSWGYGGGRGGGDPSNTQFALLALGAAQDRGIKVPKEVFQRSLKYWKIRQGRKGGWGYGAGSSNSGSMTCAGIASVIIARGRLSDGSSQVVGDNIQCCGGADTKEDPVAKGIEWLANSFSVDANPGGTLGTYYYYLYALERVGRLSGRRFIGKHDWYREGANVLIDQQDTFQGFWSGGGWENDRNVTTSFALLFLSKGKRQVVIGQLDHSGGKNSDWQKHPDAMRQLVRHVERDWGRDLTWQSIDAERASVKDLLQTPVLVISDNKALNFSSELRERLKKYLDQGGTILFEADGGDGCSSAAPFQASVQKLCAEWFDNATLDRLPPSHPVWYAERKVDVNVLPKDLWIYGVQACCRTSVFYVPKTLSCRWELSEILLRRKQHSQVACDQIDLAVRLGQNIIAYATGRELKDKLEERVLLSGDDLEASDRGAIRMTMLGLDAGGDEAKRALPNAAAIIRQRGKIALAGTKQPVGFDAKSLQDVFVLWIHGRTEFQFTAQQRDLLRDYIQNGGVVLGSSICGSEAFAKSFRKEISLILPGSAMKPLPPGHPAFSADFDGDDIRRVTIRTPIRDGRRQQINRRTSHPVIEAVNVDGVAGAFFSPLDLSCALESQNSVQCPGYSTDDAAKIVGNLVLFALQQ